MSRQLPVGTILISSPKTGDPYYKGMEGELVGFYSRIVSAAHPSDKFVIACDPPRAKELRSAGVPEANLLVNGLPDIWIRDICPVITPKGAFNFLYRPSYLKRSDAKYFEDAFNKFLAKRGVVSSGRSLNLDGGNYCHNGVDKAVVCDRVFKENPGLTTKRLVEILAPITGSDAIAILPTEKGDTLGHADGMVSWLAADVLAVNQFDEPFHSKVMKELEWNFPDVKLVVMPYEPSDRDWKGIADASGVYTNILHTPNAAYVSSYGSPSDAKAKAMVEKYCSRRVIPVKAEKVTRLGGGLRCLTWQRRASSWSTPL
ncbi:hypothetical protein BSKO_01555 [Bryopsis sp. KO-2023]|nr:hypothetical protein BSKO_01555 [Bryopsis sp. KO-2023]